MKNKYFLLIAAIFLLAYSCNPNKNTQSSLTISPEAGSSYKSGDVIKINVHYGTDVKPDSIVYQLDSARLGTKKDSSTVSFKTDTMALGARGITAKVYQGGKSQDVSTNIVLYAAKAPEVLTYRIEKVFSHDTSCYTEGLVYQDGYLYESGGGYLDPPPGQEMDGQSSLRKVDLTTGKVVKKVLVDPKVFAEGISIVGNKIIQLTWTQKIGYVYDKDTFKLIKTFANNVGAEGWGMCFDGNKMYMDDSTNRIWFLDKDDYHAKGFIDVYDDKGPMNNINELEYIDGKIFANVFQTNDILVIDPKTGAVLQKIDMTNLYPQNKRNMNADVLNGIAYDKATGRIFITGKKWDKLFQVKFSPPAP